MTRASGLLRALGPAVALVAVGAVAPAPGAAQSTAGRPELDAVNFVGNDTFASDSLARAIVNKETQCRSIFVQPACWLGLDFSISEGFLNRREIARDALRLRIYYQQRGFRETLVDTATVVSEDGQSATLTFEIDEGRPVVVDTIFIEGLEGFEGPDVTGNLPIDEGDRLSTLVLDASRDSIRRRLQNNGYANAEVLRSWRIENDDRYAADVTFDVYTGPVAHYGTITVVGNDELTDETIRRTLQFDTGDRYNRDQLRRAQARLFGLEIIRNAQVADSLDPEALEPDSVVDITVTVAEGDPHRVRGGAGWNSAECLNAEGRWTHRNFLGGARRVQVRGRVGNIGAQQAGERLCWDSGTAPFNELTWLLAADLAQPWIFSTRNSFQAGLFGERQSVPDVFVREAVGLSFALTRALGPRTPLIASYRPELSRLDAAEFLFCTSFLVCRPQDIDVLQGANWLAPVGLTMTRATTDNVLNPGRGYTVNVDLEHGSALTGSNFRFDRIETSGTYFTQPTDGGLILAFRARGGWVSAGVFDQLLGENDEGGIEIVHPQKRFYSGGANSVRGYGQNRLGPKVLTVLPIDVGRLFAPTEEEGAGCTPQELIALTCDASALDPRVFNVRPTGGTAVMEANVEARVPFGANMQMAGFLDVGRMWQAGGFQDSPFVISPGVGMRYMSAIGPIRIDVAYRFEGAPDLQVVTTQIRPFNALVDDREDRIRYTLDGVENPVVLEYVPIEQLALLEPLVTFEEGSSFLRRFQIHLSLGQAF